MEITYIEISETQALSLWDRPLDIPPAGVHPLVLDAMREENRRRRASFGLSGTVPLR